MTRSMPWDLLPGGARRQPAGVGAVGVIVAPTPSARTRSRNALLTGRADIAGARLR